MRYETLNKEIIKHIGGKGNVIDLNHCVTRLRFKLKDYDKPDIEALKKIDGVITAVRSGGQFQVVIGNHVDEVYKELTQMIGLGEGGRADTSDSGGDKGNMFQRFINTVSGIFQPVLGVLAATGMLKGFLTLFVTVGWMSDASGTYTVLYAISDCFFYSLPIFIGYSAAIKFGVDKFIGMAIGASLIYPTIAGINSLEPIMTLFQGTIFESPVSLTFMGIPLIIPATTYTSSVIPVIVAALFAAPVERFMRKVIPSVVRRFLVPFFTLLIVVPISFLVIGPVTSWLSSAVGAVIMGAYGLSPIIAGLVLGAVWQVFVIFGLHWGVVSLALISLVNPEMALDPLLPLTFACSFAQTGVVIAIMLKTKDKELKGLSIPAIISGFFGITEPAIYGITLPRVKTFIASCVVGAIGGAAAGFLGVKTYTIGGLGVFGYTTFINPAGPENFVLPMIIISIIAVVLGIVAGFLTFKDEEKVLVAAGAGGIDVDLGTANTNKSVSTASDDYVIGSPFKGEVMPLSETTDEAFSSGAIGKGVAIKPTDGKLYAPIDGEVTALFETNHAIGLTSDNGVEIMIHVGIDTVQLKGKHFTAHIKQGDKVKKGQLLEEINLEGIEADGYSIITPVVVTNYMDHLDVIGTDKKEVMPGDELIYVVRDQSGKA